MADPDVHGAVRDPDRCGQLLWLGAAAARDRTGQATGRNDGAQPLARDCGGVEARMDKSRSALARMDDRDLATAASHAVCRAHPVRIAAVAYVAGNDWRRVRVCGIRLFR